MKNIFNSSLILILMAAVGFAQTSYPMLMTLEPIAIQVGTSSEMVVKSRSSM